MTRRRKHTRVSAGQNRSEVAAQPNTKPPRKTLKKFLEDNPELKAKLAGRPWDEIFKSAQKE
jgi:hypothetical protein